MSWVLDADIRDFFGSLDRSWLEKFLRHRIADERVLRLIGKWMAAGVIEDGKLSEMEQGTPQGAPVSWAKWPALYRLEQRLSGPAKRPGGGKTGQAAGARQHPRAAGGGRGGRGGRLLCTAFAGKRLARRARAARGGRLGLGVQPRPEAHNLVTDPVHPGIRPVPRVRHAWPGRPSLARMVGADRGRPARGRRHLPMSCPTCPPTSRPGYLACRNGLVAGSRAWRRACS